MALYQDQIKKLAYYRARITQELASKGIYPDDTLIKDRLSRIDSMLGIFQYITIAPGSVFDTAKFNEDFLRVLADLQILYQLAYELSVKDFDELRVYCDTHLSQLMNMAQGYQYKTKFELDSTYLGNTIFFQGNGFEISGNNGTAQVSLGTIEPEVQSKLACIFNSPTVAPKDVIFSFKDAQGNILNCSPYSYNNDFFTIPGTLKANTYTYVTNGEEVTTAFIVTPEALVGKVNHDNKYLLFGGEGYLSTGYYSKEYIQKIAGVPVSLTDSGVVTFWIVNGSYATFEFSQIPDSKNFDGTSIKEMPTHQKVVIEYSNDLMFDFFTDGTIYATKQIGTIVNNELYYPVPDQVEKILIEEYSVGDKIPYEVTVLIKNIPTDILPKINTIAIKQLSTLEDVL